MTISNIIFSIVLYKTPIVDLEKCLDSIDRLDTYLKYSSKLTINKISILDNSYKNNISKIFLKYNNLNIEYHLNIKNCGYGKGHNLNFKNNPNLSKNDFFIAMNPDIFFKAEQLVPIFEYLLNVEYSCASPLIYLADKSIQYSAKRNPTFLSLILGRLSLHKGIRFFKSYIYYNQNRNHNYLTEIIESEYLSGCFMIFNPEIFNRIKGFDNNYFLHLEDADITRRCIKHAKCIHYPFASINHRRARGSHKSIRQHLFILISYITYIKKWGFNFL